jgi:putative ATPase
MKELDYGKGYKYAHDYEEGYVYQQNLPEALEGKRYYEPTERGQEKRIGERLAYWRNQADEARQQKENKSTES